MEGQVQYLKALGLSAGAPHDEQLEEILKDVEIVLLLICLRPSQPTHHA